MSKERQYAVLLFNSIENKWGGVTAPMSKKEATKYYNEKTENGTIKTSRKDPNHYIMVEIVIS